MLLENIPYLGPDRHETLDAYLPDEEWMRPLPAVLLIHGGGWHGGDKADERERNIGTNLSREGFAVFSINYLLNRYTDRDIKRPELIAWPQNLYDCKSAVRFLRAEAGRFGIDPSRIGVMGGSAGGSFALLLGATAGDTRLNAGGLYTEQPSGVSCVITFYGIPDARGRWEWAFAGASPEETDANTADASVVTHLPGTLPPVFVAHGTGDTLVPVEHSRNLAGILAEQNLPYQYLEISGAPHTFHLQPTQLDLRPAVLEFLRRTLGNPTRTQLA